MANNGYVQIPPDSTGKKISHVILLELDYVSGTTDFAVGDIVLGGSSGATGTVVKLSDDSVTATGELYLSMDYESVVAFTDGEALTVGGSTYALASGTGTTIYSPTVSIVDHENAFNGVNVSAQGELIISPSEGAFAFDSFGQLKVSEEQYLGLYNYEYGINQYLLNTETSSLGLGETIYTASYYSGIEATNPADSGSLTRVQSHMYHPYQAGTPYKWIGSFACGDSGTTNVVRRWGLFEDDDGCFFELSGSALSVNIRNSSTTGLGSFVLSKVEQANWNVDRCDGNGGERNISLADIDAGKGFVYFIDLQWLGVGRVRFGIIWGGQRVVCHEFKHNAELDYPYMRSACLPARFEQVNVDTAASPTVIRNFSMAVISSHQQQPSIGKRIGGVTNLTASVDWQDDFRPVFSLRPKDYFNGRENRAIIIPTDMEIWNEGGPVAWQIRQWPTLTGDTWSVPDINNDATEADFTATTASGGNIALMGHLKPNDVTHRDFRQEYDEALKLFRQDHIANDNCAWTLMVKSVPSNLATSSSISLAFNWKEIY